MREIVQYQQNISYISKIWQRCYLAYLAFTSPDLTPCIKMKNGVIIDIENQRVIIPGDFNLHTTGNLRLTSDKHVIIKSGRTPEERDGYVYGVWINSEEDNQGNPLLEQETNYLEVEKHDDR
jgi:hypothetical protein